MFANYRLPHHSLEIDPRSQRLGRFDPTQNCVSMNQSSFRRCDAEKKSQYEFERQKYAQDLIDFDKQFARLFSGKPRTEQFQDGVSHEDFLK
jgi:hypothetical protein